MCINLDLLADVGYTLPSAENWTIAEFLKMAEKVKNKYDGEKFGTGMFAANQSGDYLINNWFASFGVQYYADGYDYTTIKETGGTKVYEFFQLLVANGYIPDHAGQLSDDDYVMQWARGELAATAFFEGWTEPYFKSAAEQGYDRFDYVFYPFPKAEGVDKVPTYFMNATLVVYDSGDKEIDTIAAKLAQYMNSVEIQENASLQNVLPTRKDARNLSTNIHNVEISTIAMNNGFFDVGLTNPTFPIIRPLHYPILQKVLSGDFTPEEAITAYEKAINAEL
jgi:ABC-type glycerol-3-phosphate transport system substrate-binding protein